MGREDGWAHPWNWATVSIRVLIADDEPPLLRMVVDLIRAHDGFEVTATAADADEAAERAAETMPDVALLDVRMPGMSGIEVCRRLQADGSAPGARIVLITGTPDPVLSTQAAEAGAVALLGKETPPGTIASQLLAAAEGRVGWSVE